MAYSFFVDGVVLDISGFAIVLFMAQPVKMGVLYTHESRPTNFTLTVDDLGVK